MGNRCIELVASLLQIHDIFLVTWLENRREYRPCSLGYSSEKTQRIQCHQAPSRYEPTKYPQGNPFLREHAVGPAYEAVCAEFNILSVKNRIGIRFQTCASAPEELLLSYQSRTIMSGRDENRRYQDKRLSCSYKLRIC